MDNEAIVDQIVRNLSFEVVAVPQEIVHLNSTSKSTPLNVKIRVRKKNDSGFRHGVLSMPKVDRKDNVPKRIRLVSSDQTIMSFNVLMEADFDNVPPKHRKQNLNTVSPGLANKEEKHHLSKNAGHYSTSPYLAKRNKDIFGTCKPGGCLDPPYGEEKYSYRTTQQNLSLAPKNDEKNNLRSSSIFKNKIFKKKKKSSNDELSKTDKKSAPEADSILSLYETGSLQTPTNYSNSIMTYPHPSNSSLLRLQDEKLNKKRYSSEDKSMILVAEGNGSYFMLPKKAKKSIQQNDFEITPLNYATEDFKFKKNTNETDHDIQINPYKSSQHTKVPNFLPIPIPIPLPIVSKNDNKESVVENNKTEDETKLLMSNDYNINSTDDQVNNKILNMSNENDFDGTLSSEDKSKLQEIQPLNYYNDIKEKNIIEDIFSRDAQTNLHESEEDDKNKNLTDQNAGISPSTDMTYDKSNNLHIYSEGSEIKSNLIIPTRNKSLLNITTKPSQRLQDTENISKVSVENSETGESYSTEDLRKIWQNETTALESAADVITKTTLPIEKDLKKDVDISEIDELLTNFPEEKQSAGALELKQSLSLETLSYRMTEINKKDLKSENASDSNLNQKKAKVTKESCPETDSTLGTVNPRGIDVTENHAGQLLENFEKMLLNNVNKDDENLKSQIQKNKSENTFTPDALVKTSNLSRDILKDSGELSEKSSNVDFTSTVTSLSQTATNVSEINNDLSEKLSVADSQTDNDMSDSNIRKFRTDVNISKTLSFSADTNLTSKGSTDYGISENVSTQSIIDTKSSIYKNTIQDDKYIKNNNSDVTDTELLEKVGSGFDSIPYEDIKNDHKIINKSHISEQFSEVSFKIPHPTTILRKGLNPWKVDIALQAYKDENNERVIKSFDSEKIPARRQSDALLVAQCVLRSDSNEIKIPIDLENDLCVQIKTNRSRNQSTWTTKETSENTGLSDEQHKKKKIKMVLPDSMENKSEAMTNKTISDDVRDVLIKIYEQELVPLQRIIKGLREEIDMLAAYQMKFKEKVPLTSNRPRPLRLVNGNKKCPCVRRL